MPTDARTAAFQTLLRAEKNGAFLNLALDAALKNSPAMDAADRALATELVYGVARRQRLLDATIGAHSSRPTEKLDAAVLVALRLGAYQLFFTRTKPHAAVNETVELVKSLPAGKKAAGFVNALMRAFSRLPGPAVPEGGTEASRLAVECSQPTWLAERWIDRFGLEEARALCRIQNETPAIDVRFDPARVSGEDLAASLSSSGVQSEPAALSPVGLSLSGAGGLTELTAFREGLFQVQDEAAQLVGLLPDVRPGMDILDACAAPGGKTCHLAQRLRGKGHVTALDLHAHRLDRLRPEAERLGLAGLISAKACDVSRPLPFDRGRFDLILADLPCTGLGTTRRHPEIRYRRTREDPARMAEVQRRIAGNLAAYVKPGGQLIFSVCSMEPEEGLDQLEGIEALGFRLVPPDASCGVCWPLISEEKPAIATFPHRHGCDGFFGARFIKEG